MFYLTAKTRLGLEEKIADLESKIQEVNASFVDVVDSSSWHDNFDFEQTQQRRDFFESQLTDFRQKLKSCQIITPNQQTDRVDVGHKVVMDTGENYTVLGELDADPDQNFISYLSPIGRELIGKRAGDKISDGRKITAIFPADL